MKFLSIVGARPQFIKLSPLCRAIDTYHSAPTGEVIKSIIVHTGQHYDYELSKVFFDQMRIPTPNYDLEVGSASHGQQTGAMLEKIEEVLFTEKPDIVIVFGDTNSTLAGALAASKLHISVAHVEAGLRSYNKKMPEEINRVITDHVSTLLFCPTERAVSNLQREGFSNILDRLPPSEEMPMILENISPSNPLVIKTGDIMYDAFLFNERLAQQSSTVLRDLSLTPRKYALLTIHRAENTDDRASLEKIITFLKTEEIKYPIIFPVHPRTKKNILELSIGFPNAIQMIPPVSYFDMLILEKNAHSIYTDSGGVQKEAFFLKVPCVTLRDETEWTETVESGWNRLMNDSRATTTKTTPAGRMDPFPFGDGKAAEHHLQILIRYYQSQSDGVKQTT